MNVIEDKLIPWWLAVIVLGSRLLAAAPPAGHVPLCPGLTIVTAISQPDGDYESIKTVESIDAGVIRLKYSNEHPVRNNAGSLVSIRKLTVRRTTPYADLRSAKLYLQQFGTDIPTDVPGTTAIGTSSAVLSALKTKGEAELAMFELPSVPGSSKFSIDPKIHPNLFDYQTAYKLRRVESGAVMTPLTVNGEKTQLPAIHATGRSDYGDKAEFFFLDDESNPLSLKWRLGRSGAQTDRDTLQVVKITYRCSAPQAGMGRLERALAETGRADVYDIYFSFNSDEIREESQPTLKEIDDLLRRHPDWKLSIVGHTDGIASDAFNLDLSKRRAAAVKNALVTRFSANTGRLTTTGYGKSRPQDTNETPEGRARNRRVELLKAP